MRINDDDKTGINDIKVCIMKTASLGLLEVMVVCVNAGGDAPPDPPSVVTSRAIPPFFVFFKNRFLANEWENIFGRVTIKV